MKRGVLFLVICFLVVSIFVSGGVIAPNADASTGTATDNDKVCCQYPGAADEPLYEWRAIGGCKSPEGAEWGNRIVDDSFCKGEDKLKECRDKCKKLYDDEETRSKCISGCKSDFGFIEVDDDYSCEDMPQEECELTDACEGIFGPSSCEGDVCTMDMVWKGCRYEGDEFFEGYEDEELKQDAGTTPDSAFYFIDKFFDRFGDELEVREERIAEIKAMVEVGDLESAKKALHDYMKLAEELENEIDPERKEEAKRSAAAIRATMKDIRDQLPPEERGEFVRDVMSKEHSIAASAEISSKIKALCIQLAELDPLEYSKMCRTDDDAPKWKKELDKDLSAEQEKIAREFVNIMKQCFKTSGKDCACEEIPFYDFSIACSKAAPLATACDVDGDEVACDELDNLDMPELPEWLEPIWGNLEGEMSEAKYDMHMPPECVEAGVTNPKECGRVMIKEHSPLECKAALLDSRCDTELECRKICDKIMFDLHSPRECKDKGITDPRECAKLMETLGPMEGKMGPGFGPDCGSIDDSMERLDCYDNKGNEMGEYYGPGEGEMPEGEITWQCKEHRIHWPPDCEKFMREELPEIERQNMEEGDLRRATEEDWRVKEKECAASCDLENGWWDFRDGECVCYATEGTGPKPGEYGGEGYVEPDYPKPDDNYEESECKDGCQQECGDQNTDCVNGKCVCLGYGDNGPPSDNDQNDGEPPQEPETQTEPNEPEPEEQEDSEPESDGMTGNVFLDYYFN